MDKKPTLFEWTGPSGLLRTKHGMIIHGTHH